MSLKNRIEIYASHSEGFKIVKLLLNSLEIAAEEVILCYFSVFIGFPHGFAAPVGAQNSVGGNAVFLFARIAEAVGKNLINNRAFYPIGSFEIL